MTASIRNSKEGFNIISYKGNGGNQFIGANAGLALPASSVVYTPPSSIRFRTGATAYLSRTFGTPTNQSQFTLSLWVKRVSLGDQPLFSRYTDPSNYAHFHINSTDNVRVSLAISGTPSSSATSSAFKYTDDWIHIVYVADTNNATPASRAQLYVNGQLQALSSSHNQGSSFLFNSSGGTNYLFRYGNVATGGDFYGTSIAFVDGKLLTPDKFGYLDSITNTWLPLAPATVRSNVSSGGGTRNGWGTNGCFLLMNDTPSNTTVYDRSQGDSDVGGNNWTATSISNTNDYTMDWTSDVPGNNYLTLDPAASNRHSSAYSVTTTNGNLGFGNSGGSASTEYRTYAPDLWKVSTGKYIVGVRQTTSGSCEFGFDSTPQAAMTWGYVALGLEVRNDGSTTFAAGVNSSKQISFYINGSTVFSAGMTFNVWDDITVLAVDFDAGKVWVGWVNSANGTTTWYNSGNPATGNNATATFRPNTQMLFAVETYVTASGFNVCTGSQGWPTNFVLPTGFKTFCNANMPAFNTTTQQIDFAILKDRDTTASWAWADTLRGLNNYVSSNSTNAEVSDYSYLNPQLTKRACLHTGSSLNTLGHKFIAYGFSCTTRGQTNNSGTITSTVSANPRLGFSMLTYTGNGTNGATVGHGLGTTPAMIIVKGRNIAREWQVQHQSLTSSAYQIQLNNTAAQFLISSASYGGVGTWNTTTFTCTAGSVSSDAVNASGSTYVAYCFIEVPGFSKIGSYVCNSSSDNTFVFCGFKPKLILVKDINSGSGNWDFFDSVRSPYNPATARLIANTPTIVEDTGFTIDVVSNGFKVRSAGTDWGVSNGDTVAFIAFADYPPGDMFATTLPGR